MSESTAAIASPVPLNELELSELLSKKAAELTRIDIVRFAEHLRAERRAVIEAMEASKAKPKSPSAKAAKRLAKIDGAQINPDDLLKIIDAQENLE